jgi:hypothetical protein
MIPKITMHNMLQILEVTFIQYFGMIKGIQKYIILQVTISP